ncbi:MAG: hypothetical protein NTW32_04145 [Chloroflexi bacterium]|nr:hypothetical protein [Chloroflexota bacterium]
MKTVFRNTLMVLAILVLAGGIFMAGTMFAFTNGFGTGWMMGSNGYGSGMMGGNGNNNYAPGMMNGNRNNNYGPGMMGGDGNNNYGPRMMDSNGNSNVAPLSVDQAKTAAEIYIKNLDVVGLQASEVMVFDNNAYIVVKETETGNGAFELLVNSDSQTAYPEFGPNMMWNLKYGGLNHSEMKGGSNGMMNGMMGGNNMMGGDGWDTTVQADVSTEMNVTSDKAIGYAQKYLDAKVKGATAATDPIKFYGYYTIDFEKDGKVAGMLSVNGYSGQVFLHTWHGTFIEESAMP